MEQLLSDDLWPTIKRLAKRKCRKRAAIAYVTSEETVKFGSGDLLVTDASDEAIKAGRTSASVLEGAVRRGAKVFSLPNLHAKIFLLDGTAIIGSANLSMSSESGLIEAAWVSDSPAAVALAGSIICRLSESADRVDDAFLNRIKSLPVSPRTWNGHAPSQPRSIRKKHKRQTWLIGLHEFDERDSEAKATEKARDAAMRFLTDDSSDAEYVRFSGNSRFRLHARRWDSVIQIWRAKGRKRPSSVYRHAPIIDRQEDDRFTRFFVEGLSNADETAISWSRFQRLANQVGLPFEVKPNMARPISEQHSQALFALWGES